MVKVGGTKCPKTQPITPKLKPKKYISKETLYILSDSNIYQRNQKFKRRGKKKRW
uniref:Uncharacterized protein n=1 Tax=Uncultured archaeon GZfos26G2 TaxID=3386331 RepID=Q64DK6_UNCAG|nr:hypothetical protein GZ18B6_32 [uncultured archaeon GZfos18B6]